MNQGCAGGSGPAGGYWLLIRPDPMAFAASLWGLQGTCMLFSGHREKGSRPGNTLHDGSNGQQVISAEFLQRCLWMGRRVLPLRGGGWGPCRSLESLGLKSLLTQGSAPATPRHLWTSRVHRSPPVPWALFVAEILLEGFWWGHELCWQGFSARQRRVSCGWHPLFQDFFHSTQTGFTLWWKWKWSSSVVSDSLRPHGL